jgi:hypothetical protein
LTGFGSVRLFLGKKLVQTGLARFVAGWLSLARLFLVFFGLGSIWFGSVFSVSGL